MTSSNAIPWTLSARWVFPVSAPPIADGIVAIAGERIVSVEAPNGRRPDVHLGDAAILPGFVNAHTHLDLTGLRGQCPPRADFTGWLGQVIRHRRGITAEQIEADVRAGLAECLRHGTTLVGDIASGGFSWPILAAAPIRSVVFYEMLGLTRDRAAQAFAAAQAWLTDHPPTQRCRPGLSPHAPYSVRVELFEQAARLAQEAKCRLAVHLAESHDELTLLSRHSGPFVHFLQEMGVWDATGLATSPEHVLQVCDSPHSLFVHGNHLIPDNAIPHKGHLIYCPRTHAAFGHPPHPFHHYLRARSAVALGTDSLASNPDLSMLAELRFLHALHPDVPGDALLRMATLSGAESLGWADETGSLEVGKSADVVVVPLSPDGGSDPYKLLLQSASAVQRVLCRGRWIEMP